MADFIGDVVQLQPSSVAAASYTADVSVLPALEDDYVLIFVINTATAGTITEANGYTLTTLNVASGQRMAIAYKKVAAGPTIANAVFSANSGLWQAAMVLVRDADASISFNDGTIITADGGNGTSAVTGTMTPSGNDALCVYFASVRNATSATQIRFKAEEVIGEAVQSNDDATTFSSICVGTVQQGTAAASAKTFYTSQTGRLGSIVIPIKNKASGGIRTHGLAGMERLAWFGAFGITHDGITYAAPASGGVTWDGAGAINGITVSGTAATLDHGVAGPASYGAWTTISSTVYTAGAWVGIKATFGAAKDFTDKVFSAEHYIPASTIRLGVEGTIICFSDSTGAWVAYQLSQKLNPLPLMIAAIKCGTATEYASGGAIDWLDVVSMTLLYHRVGSSATPQSCLGIRNAFLLSPTTIYGGSSVRPLSAKYLNRVLNGWGYQGFCKILGPAVQLNSSVQIGDGSFYTYYDATATAVSFRPPYNKLTNREHNIPADSLELRVKSGAADTINMVAGSIVGEQKQAVIFDSTSTGSHSINGSTFVGMAPTLLAGDSLFGATFSACGPVATNGASLDSFTVSDTTAIAGEAAVVVDGSGSVLSSGTIDVTGTSADYHLELGTAVTAITLADVTFTGTPGTDKVHVLKTTGTVTITISGTTSLVAGDVTSAGATVVISAPVEYQSVTMSNYITGSRIQVYDTTNSIELYNDVPAAAPQTLWTDSVAASTSGARDIRVRVAYVSGATAKEFIEASIGTVAASGSGIALSYRVNQVDDDTYNSNAVDGSAVTGITIVEGATDRVQISIAGGSVSWASIYAYQCYWLFDVVGITDDGAFISAPDTANYILTGFKIKNTHASIPLVITGGYGVDSTGSVSVLYDTTGTSIFPAPAHVVPYATGSGVTPGDVTDIAAAVLTAAASAPIQADIRKVLGGAIDGDGSDGNPWGPV